MKVVIFAGGEGSRLGLPHSKLPKPLVEIGGKPIIWHIMKMYACQGFREFIILVGHKADEFKKLNEMIEDEWSLSVLDTGRASMTGHRLFQLKNILKKNTFLLTYADGLADIDFHRLISFHKNSKKIITVTGVNPRLPFGRLFLDEKSNVLSFSEKPLSADIWVNGGFFVCEPQVFDYLNENEDLVFEASPLEEMARQHMMACYQHAHFWTCMDTANDVIRLNQLWMNGQVPWKKWT